MCVWLLMSADRTWAIGPAIGLQTTFPTDHGSQLTSPASGSTRLLQHQDSRLQSSRQENVSRIGVCYFRYYFMFMFPILLAIRPTGWISKIVYLPPMWQTVRSSPDHWTGVKNVWVWTVYRFKECTGVKHAQMYRCQVCRVSGPLISIWDSDRGLYDGVQRPCPWLSRWDSGHLVHAGGSGPVNTLLYLWALCTLQRLQLMVKV